MQVYPGFILLGLRGGQELCPGAKTRFIRGFNSGHLRFRRSVRRPHS